MGAEFVCNLKAYRVAKGLTQEQLAERVGCTPGDHHAAGKSPVQSLPEAGH